MKEKIYLPIVVLHDFAERMDKLEIDYMLTGSTAMMRYSVYRFTADIDVVLELKSSDAEKIIRELEPDYYVPHNSLRRAVSSEKMFNVIHQETAFKVDCVTRKTNDFQRNVWRKSKSERYAA